ncbi:MAG: hypothetical protein HKN81_03660 [Gammaproteobacteria bacterium]|nr:hypothetical protein [Gammaproteobacteria bacterium]
MNRLIFGSLTRISDLADEPFDVKKLDKAHWETGDFVQGEITPPKSELYNIELQTGVMDPVEPGDRVIGAFGHREATLEGAGSWLDIDDGQMNAMTNAGLFGRFRSFSMLLSRPISLRYAGHVMRNGEKVCMRDFALKSDYPVFDIPTILLVGTSMSAGKTMTGRVACAELSALGYSVTGVKLTGAGRYRDIHSFQANGAERVYDFVDVGLPSTVVPEKEYRAAIRPLLRHIASERPDFMICEAGASPLEPYNGAAAIDELGDSVACTILCASDPYAVVGVKQAFGLEPDLVAGPATNTSSAIALVRKLTGAHGINIINPKRIPEFRDFLIRQLGLD